MHALVLQELGAYTDDVFTTQDPYYFYRIIIAVIFHVILC